MITTLVTVVLLVNPFLFSQARTPAQATAKEVSSARDVSTEAELLALENEWAFAVTAKDRTKLDRLMSDDFLMLSQVSTGPLVDKKTFIDNVLTQLELFSFSYEEVRVQVRRDVAIVHSKYKFVSAFGSRQWAGTSLLTDTWIREDGRWRVVARHSSLPPTAQALMQKN